MYKLTKHLIKHQGTDLSKTNQDYLLQETEDVGACVSRCNAPEHVYPAAGGVQDVNTIGDEAARFINGASDAERCDQGMPCGTPTRLAHTDPNSADHTAT